MAATPHAGPSNFAAGRQARWPSLSRRAKPVEQTGTTFDRRLDDSHLQEQLKSTMDRASVPPWPWSHRPTARRICLLSRLAATWIGALGKHDGGGGQRPWVLSPVAQSGGAGAHAGQRDG